MLKPQPPKTENGHFTAAPLPITAWVQFTGGERINRPSCFIKFFEDYRKDDEFLIKDGIVWAGANDKKMPLPFSLFYCGSRAPAFEEELRPLQYCLNTDGFLLFLVMRRFGYGEPMQRITIHDGGYGIVTWADHLYDAPELIA